MLGIVETYLLTALVFAGFGAIVFNLVLLVLFPLGKLAFSRFKLKSSRSGFSLIVPARNEEKVIERTIKQFLSTYYRDSDKELVIVDDASQDRTGEIASRWAYRIIDSETGRVRRNPKGRRNIILVSRKKGGRGKSYVSNDGIKHASKEILAFIDADIQIPTGFFRLAAEHFSDPEVSSVAGRIFISRKDRFLQGFIDFEFVVAQEIFRRAFNVLGIHYIVPGGCAFFRRSVIEEVGGYSHGTLAEDTDLTWKVLMDTNTKVHYDPRIKTRADEPCDLEGLWNQRVRWARGNIQVTAKHKGKVGKRQYGRAMTVFYPFWLITIIMPITFLLSSTGIFLSEYLGADIVGLDFLKVVFVGAFFLVWAAGILLGGKRSWFEGLLSPGIVLLIGMFSLLFWQDGISGMVVFMGFWRYAGVVSLIYSIWILVSIPGVYISMLIARKSKRLGNFIALGVFGYWMFLLTASFNAYIKQIRREKNVWLKTRH